MDSDCAQVVRLAATAEGWLTDSEAALLYTLARANRGNGVIVEIGSWKGKSTLCLARGSLAGRRSRVLAIDPHDATDLECHLHHGERGTLDAWRDTITRAGVDALVTPLVTRSRLAVTQITTPIDLLFVDGSHRRADVEDDLSAYIPLIRIGGVLAMHDTDAGGAMHAAIAMVYRSSQFRDVQFLDSITYAVRVEHATLWQRVRNYGWTWRLLLRYRWRQMQYLLTRLRNKATRMP